MKVPRIARQVATLTRRHALTAKEAILVGLFIGLAVGFVAALMPLRYFSLGTLVFLPSTIGSFGATAGYMAWLLSDPMRARRWLKIGTGMAPMVFAAGSYFFPRFWPDLEIGVGRELARAHQGLLFAVVMTAVGVGFALVHFMSYLLTIIREAHEPRVTLWYRRFGNN